MIQRARETIWAPWYFHPSTGFQSCLSCVSLSAVRKIESLIWNVQLCWYRMGIFQGWRSSVSFSTKSTILKGTILFQIRQGYDKITEINYCPSYYFICDSFTSMSHWNVKSAFHCLNIIPKIMKMLLCDLHTVLSQSSWAISICL